MDKFKKVALAAFIIGSLEGGLAFFMVNGMYPKIVQVYEDFGATIPTTTYLVSYILFIPVLVNFTLGGLILISKTTKEKYYFWTKLSLVGTLVFIFVILPGLLSVGFLLPLFNLVNVIK